MPPIAIASGVRVTSSEPNKAITRGDPAPTGKHRLGGTFEFLGAVREWLLNTARQHGNVGPSKSARRYCR